MKEEAGWGGRGGREGGKSNRARKGKGAGEGALLRERERNYNRGYARRARALLHVCARNARIHARIRGVYVHT